MDNKIIEKQEKMKQITKDVNNINIELVFVLFSSLLYFSMVECYAVADRILLHSNPFRYVFLDMKLSVLAYPVIIFTIIKMRNIKLVVYKHICIILISILYCSFIIYSNIDRFPIKSIIVSIIFIVNVLLVTFTINHIIREWSEIREKQNKYKDRSVYALLPLILIPLILCLTLTHFVIF